ncbi:Predicted arabinose efflux permease, MFS family [Pseudomonas sp. NFACC02]|uniref:MFS transporter n=1 Tax=Pseudomonas sp. NFACC02 TaxID=1566250 RepID=UPI0008ABA395|nr:MFS transporter [Pseudomonas sp. NFACC02]SEQ62887.1 Predicted arabinose efflux permease, MFS family [Pseudomonas sp. NFACC02]
MKTPKTNPIDTPSVYVCAGLVSGAGALLLNVLPVLFGAFAERFGLGEQQLGNLAMAMNLGFGAFGLASLLWIHRLSWRVISALSSALVAGAIMFVLRDPSYEALLAIMALAGAGTGALYALAMTIFGDSSQPERAFGFKLGIETVPGAFLLIVLPVAVAPVWGFDGMLITIAIAMVVMGILPLPWVPRRSERRLEVSGTAVRIASTESRIIVWLSLVASLVFLTGIMSVWAFLELMGKKTGLASDTIGMVLALGFLINAGGGFIASAIGLKVGRFMPVAVIILAELLGLVALAQFSSLVTYVAGVICFLFSIGFVLAYTFGVMAEFDLSGELVALGALCLSLGAAFGPAIGGVLIEAFGYSSVLWFSGVCSVAVLAIYGAAVMRAQLTFQRIRVSGTVVMSGL